MGVPKTYQTGGGPLVTFPAVDIASGISRTDLFLGRTAPASGALSNIIFYSNEISVPLAPVKTKFNFDMLFKRSQIIDGPLLTQLGYTIVGGGGGPADGWINIGFAKISNGVQTEIISGAMTTETFETGVETGASSTREFNFPNTLFKEGDILRVWTESSSEDATHAFVLGTDPFARTTSRVSGANTYTDSRVQMPFKVVI